MSDTVPNIDADPTQFPPHATDKGRLEHYNRELSKENAVRQIDEVFNQMQSLIVKQALRIEELEQRLRANR